jgi:RimJ/RimL family protein N-acetyltransferase
MATIAAALPLLGLRITAGPIELRGVTDDLLLPLAEVASAGIHDADAMPFSVAWSLTPPDEMPLTAAQYHWGQRARFSPARWSADFAVFYDGELVGSQGISTEDYLITRTGETGSWLARRYQGKGIGTAMRQVICAFAIDHLDAEQITSGAFTDNLASLAVSRKCGYTDNGQATKVRMGKRATLRRVVLEPANLVRYSHELTVEVLPEFRRSIGLDQPLDQPDKDA